MGTMNWDTIFKNKNFLKIIIAWDCFLTPKFEHFLMQFRALQLPQNPPTLPLCYTEEMIAYFETLQNSTSLQEQLTGELALWRIRQLIAASKEKGIEIQQIPSIYHANSLYDARASVFSSVYTIDRKGAIVITNENGLLYDIYYKIDECEKGYELPHAAMGYCEGKAIIRPENLAISICPRTGKADISFMELYTDRISPTPDSDLKSITKEKKRKAAILWQKFHKENPLPQYITPDLCEKIAISWLRKSVETSQIFVESRRIYVGGTSDGLSAYCDLLIKGEIFYKNAARKIKSQTMNQHFIFYNLVNAESSKKYTKECFELGKILLKGNKAFDKDEATGKLMMYLSAQRGYSPACLYVGKSIFTQSYPFFQEKSKEVGLSYLSKCTTLDADLLQKMALYCKNNQRMQEFETYFMQALNLGASITNAEIHLDEMAMASEDVDKKIEYFSQAVKLGNTLACYHLATLQESLLSAVNHKEEIYQLYIKAATGGIIDAYFPLAHCLYKGLGCAKDDKMALSWLKRISEDHKDFLRGQFLESRIYYWGLVNVEKNRSKAISILENLSKNGYEPATRELQNISSGNSEYDYDFLLNWCYNNLHNENAALLLYSLYGENSTKGIEVLRNTTLVSEKAKLILAKGLCKVPNASAKDRKDAKKLFEEIQDAFDEESLVCYGEILLAENTSESIRKLRKLLRYQSTTTESLELLWLETQIYTFMRKQEGILDGLSDREIYCYTAIANSNTPNKMKAIEYLKENDVEWR